MAKKEEIKSKNIEVKSKETINKTKPETESKSLIEFNLTNIILLLGLIALPIAGLMLHNKLHPNVTYLPYILWFDITVISLLFLFKKTRFYGFMLNTVFFAVGVIMHLTIVGLSTISDVLIAIPDFSIGYVLWRLNLN